MRMIQQWSVSLLNLQRARVRAIDYVMIQSTGFVCCRFPKKRNFVQRQVLGAPPISLMEFVDALDRIGEDPRPLGVILYFRGLSASTADLGTMRDAILRLRDKGKRALSFAPAYRTGEYYVASACDEILLPPGGMLETSGMFSQQVFLKEGLLAVGLRVGLSRDLALQGRGRHVDAYRAIARGPGADELAARFHLRHNRRWHRRHAQDESGRGQVYDRRRLAHG